MHDTFGDDKALPRVETYQLILEIDQELTLNDVEKLIIILVFVPMVFTTEYPQPYDEPFTWQSVWLYH